MRLPPDLLLTFYGDDFTGSTDTMEALAKAGLRTVLFLAPPTPETLARFPGLRAVGVAGVSRSLSPTEMDAELPPIFAKLRALPAPLFHVKICSTFDSAPHIGSVGHTIEIGQRLYNSPFVPLVVGAPVLNRFCAFGNLFARSGPESDVFRLDRHPTMSRHPVTPMHESDLRRHLAEQTTRSIGLVNVLELDGPRSVVSERVNALVASGQEIVLFDTLTESHLIAIGETLWSRASVESPLFVVGSSGVEYALANHWRENGELPEPPSFAADPVSQIAVVSGSCSPVTAQQIDWAVAHGFVEVALDPVALLAMRSTENTRHFTDALQTAVGALRKGVSVVVHTCKGPDDPRLTAATEWLRQHGEKAGASERDLGRLLGKILLSLWVQSGVSRVVVAGGDTSGYVARELGIEALETITPMAPGSPLCRAYAPNSDLDGLEILFKGGQVGRVDLFGSVLRGAV